MGRVELPTTEFLVRHLCLLGYMSVDWTATQMSGRSASCTDMQQAVRAVGIEPTATRFQAEAPTLGDDSEEEHKQHEVL